MEKREESTRKACLRSEKLGNGVELIPTNSHRHGEPQGVHRKQLKESSSFACPVLVFEDTAFDYSSPLLRPAHSEIENELFGFSTY